MRDYYIYEYVYDHVQEKYTSHEGEIKGYLRAEDVMDAMAKFGVDDFQRYDARQVADLGKHMKTIKDEKKHLNKVEKQLKAMIAYHEAADKICSNCDIPLNDKLCCDKCGFGHEKEKKLEEVIKRLEDGKDKVLADGIFSDEDEYTTYLDDLKKELKQEIINNA